MPDLVFHFLSVNLRSSPSLTDPPAGMCARGGVRGYPSPLFTVYGNVPPSRSPSPSISLYFADMNGAFMDEPANEGSILCD